MKSMLTLFLSWAKGFVNTEVGRWVGGSDSRKWKLIGVVEDQRISWSFISYIHVTLEIRLSFDSNVYFQVNYN